ncbi:MAG: O-antigen ligase family protein, partial [Bacteroidota bacterium]|nr:O-antigen ligase family protein [Bacteroidota bacterium]
SRPLKGKEINTILWFFTATVLVASLISFGAYLGFGGFEYTNIREISIYISHIRFALMIDLAIFHVIYYLFKNIHRQKVWLSGLQFLILVWLLVFLLLLKSMTGIVILVVVGTVLTIIYIRKLSNFMLKYFLSILLLTGFMVIVFGMSNYYARFSFVEPVEIENLTARTMNGNSYSHEIENIQLENGERVWLYYCEEELIEAWNIRSEFDFWGKDKKGQDLRITLIRYLSSKGFRKDSLGLVSLGEDDIRNVENGLANYIYADKISFYPVFYEVMWQIREYRNGGDPSAHSITQRFEYFSTGISIVKNHFWFGVGTGDVPGAFEEQYDTDNSQLDKEWRLRGHNQYLTFLISFGSFGFILIMFVFLFPVFREKTWKSYYSGVFLAIIFLSMLNEDTFETSVGAVFFAYFYALFLFSKQTVKLNEPE